MEPSLPDLHDAFERFLQLPTSSVERTLSGAADLVASYLGADKVDVFVYDRGRATLIAIGASHQPLTSLQKSAGLDVMPLANGGRVVEVFETGQPFLAGDQQNDPDELKGVREVLRVQSQIAVLMEIGSVRYGVLSVTSQTRDRWGPAELAFTRAVTRWVGIVAHRAQLLVEVEKNAREAGRRGAAEELVTIVAHDLRNYLAPLGMRLGTLRVRAERDGRVDDVRDVDRSLMSVSRIDGFISDLLDVARIDHGLFALHPEPVELATLAEEVAAINSTAHARVLVDAPERLVVSADAQRIRQCLENLVSNALGHTPEGSTVFVSITRVHREGRAYARIDVLDEGPGIPADILPHVFERFVSGKRLQGGMGLGLYVGKRIAVMHGGNLTVDASVRRGACFSLMLPLDGADGVPGAQTPSTDA